MGIDADGRKYTSPDGSKTWEYLAILTCSIMSGCIGFVVGWNSPSIVILMSEDSPIPVTASSVSTLVAVVAVGHMLAPPINIFIVDKFGRKNTLLFSALPLLVSWSLITIATSIWNRLKSIVYSMQTNNVHDLRKQIQNTNLELFEEWYFRASTELGVTARST